MTVRCGGRQQRRTSSGGDGRYVVARSRRGLDGRGALLRPLPRCLSDHARARLGLEGFQRIHVVIRVHILIQI